MQTVSLKEQAKYFKQVKLDAKEQAVLQSIRSQNLPGYAGKKAYNAGGNPPVLRLTEPVGCNCQIGDLITLTDEQGSAIAVLNIGDKWLDQGVKDPILFGGIVTFL